MYADRGERGVRARDEETSIRCRCAARGGIGEGGYTCDRQRQVEREREKRKYAREAEERATGVKLERDARWKRERESGSAPSGTRNHSKEGKRRNLRGRRRRELPRDRREEEYAA